MIIMIKINENCKPDADDHDDDHDGDADHDDEHDHEVLLHCAILDYVCDKKDKVNQSLFLRLLKPELLSCHFLGESKPFDRFDNFQPLGAQLFCCCCFFFSRMRSSTHYKY